MSRVFVVALLAAWIALSTVHAQQHPESRRDRVLENAASEKDAREMVEMVMMVRLSREMDLTEEETVLLVRRMDEFRSEMGDLQREQRRRAEALRKAAAGDNEEATLNALQKLKDVDQRISELKLQAHDRLAEGLTPKQQARLYSFLQDFEENMRRMVQRVRERSRMMEGGRMGGRGGPPPPPQRRMMREDDHGDPPRGDGDRGARSPERDARDNAPTSEPSNQPE